MDCGATTHPFMGTMGATAESSATPSGKTWYIGPVRCLNIKPFYNFFTLAQPYFIHLKANKFD